MTRRILFRATLSIGCLISSGFVAALWMRGRSVETDFAYDGAVRETTQRCFTLESLPNRLVFEFAQVSFKSIGRDGFIKFWNDNRVDGHFRVITVQFPSRTEYEKAVFPGLSRAIDFEHFPMPVNGFNDPISDRTRFYIAHWILFVAFLVYPLATLARLLSRRSLRAANRCLDCGYDLRASPERCPECGRASERTHV